MSARPFLPINEGFLVTSAPHSCGFGSEGRRMFGMVYAGANIENQSVAHIVISTAQIGSRADLKTYIAFAFWRRHRLLCFAGHRRASLPPMASARSSLPASESSPCSHQMVPRSATSTTRPRPRHRRRRTRQIRRSGRHRCSTQRQR